jgi:hypothetical protein
MLFCCEFVQQILNIVKLFIIKLDLKNFTGCFTNSLLKRVLEQFFHYCTIKASFVGISICILYSIRIFHFQSLLPSMLYYFTFFRHIRPQPRDIRAPTQPRPEPVQRFVVGRISTRRSSSRPRNRKTQSDRRQVRRRSDESTHSVETSATHRTLSNLKSAKDKANFDFRYGNLILLKETKISLSLPLSLSLSVSFSLTRERELSTHFT